MQCVICQQSLSVERLEALEFLETPKNNWTCVECSAVKKIKGVYFGEQGSGALILVSNLGDSEGIEEYENYPECH